MNATMVKPGDAIKAMLATASQAPPEDRERMEEELRRLEQTRAELLNVEEGAQQKLGQRISHSKAHVLGLKYPILSAEPLSWRDEQGFPKLVPFSIGSTGIVSFNSKGDRPALPSPLWECYHDVTKQLSKLRWHRPLGR